MVYIDLLIIEDIFMNYLIIITTGILLKRITKIKRVLLSSLVGLIPLLFFFTINNKILLFIITILFSFIMSIISFKYHDFLYTFKNIIYIFFVSIFLAGSLYLININILPTINNYLVNVLILIFLSPIITYIFIQNITNLKNNYSNYYLIDIYLKDKPKITVNAYLDTGNILKDPYTLNPIILIEESLINIKDYKYFLVPYNTIDNHSLLKCFKPAKIYIHNYGYTKKVTIGLIKKVSIEGANCILNKNILERMK